MEALFEEKMLLRKKVDYLEECVLRRIDYKAFFNEQITFKSSAYRKSLLSFKTGRFQREVASKEEFSMQTNRLSVKQDFF